MRTIGFVGAGHMGAGLGWALRQGGHDVVTTLAGRSVRTSKLVRQAGMGILPDLDAVVSAAQIVLVVTPPDAAVEAAAAIAAAGQSTGARPLVGDLNAISPSTMERVAAVLASAALDVVDGSISGHPPTTRPGARIDLSGPRAHEIAGLEWSHVQPVVVSGRVGDASAVKMCTASVDTGVTGVLAQAVRAAVHYGVVDHVLTDLSEGGYEPAVQIATAATKAWRFVPQMREIATTQRAAGLRGDLFEAMAMVYEQLARTELARHDPETSDRDANPTEIAARLRAYRPRRP
jgi:3-hydroxyisobutyrate dehydrogenase-like beta-hydroxyacid dehydrogenase